jgi:hypothetical protein
MSLNNYGHTCVNLKNCGHIFVNLNKLWAPWANLINYGKTCVKITVIDICEPEKLWEEM